MAVQTSNGEKDSLESKLVVPVRLCEVARSFSYKLNVGNYESRDFFCSQKVECRLEEAEETSKRLYDFCRTEVMNAVNEYKKTHNIK